MEHFPATLSRRSSDELVARFEEEFERDGYGLWAVQVREDGRLAGFVGLTRVPARMPFAPAVEAGWRLGAEHWGQGLAAEAARAALLFGFERVGLQEIVAYTALSNARSQRLMQRLGMHRDRADDFLHPALDPRAPLAPHVLYRLAAGDWRARGG